MAILFNGFYSRNLGKFLGGIVRPDSVWNRHGPIIDQTQGAPVPDASKYLLPDDVPPSVDPAQWLPTCFYIPAALSIVAAMSGIASPLLPPTPPVTPALSWGPEYQELLPRRLVVPQYQDFAAPVFPPAVTTPTQPLVYFPDRIERAVLSVVNQFSVTEISPKPERTSQLAATTFPDRIDRRTFGAEEQQFTTELSPKPERKSPLSVAVFPDRVDRPTFGAHEQQASVAPPPKPERTAPIAVAVFPDRVDRPQFGAHEQQAVSEVQPKPEETTEVSSAVFPDRVDRPTLGAHLQQSVSEISPKPERTSPLAVAVFPDRIDRPGFGANQQLASTEISPKPERTTAIASVVFPDRIDRPTFLPSEQMASPLEPPKPEETIPIPSASWPDSVIRPSLGAHQQLAASEIPPKPERKSPLAQPVFPDRINAAVFRAADHQSFAIAPQTTPRIDTSWTASQPERVVRPYLPVSEFQSFACTLLVPVAVVVFPPAVEFADSVNRFRTSPETFEVTVPRDRKVPIAISEFPDHVARPFLPTADHQAFATSPKPEILPVSVQFPERAVKPYLPVADHQAFATAIKPERTSPLAASVFADRVVKPYLPVADHQAFALPPRHERTAPLAAVEFPDQVRRPFIQTASQQASLVVPPKPEQPVPFSAGIAPDYIWKAPALGVENQLAFATSVRLPDVPPLTWLPQYSDIVWSAPRSIDLRSAYTFGDIPRPNPPFVPHTVTIRDLKPGDVVRFQLKPPLMMIFESVSNGTVWMRVSRPQSSKSLYRSMSYGYVVANDPTDRVITIRIPDLRTVNVPGAQFMQQFTVCLTYSQLLNMQLFLPPGNMSPEVMVVALLRPFQIGQAPKFSNIVRFISENVIII